MNLLALLQRTAPAVPVGIGRIHSADSPSAAPLPIPEEAPKINNRVERGDINRAKVLAAVCAGRQRAAAIQQATSVCRGTVFNHLQALAKDGLITIKKSRWENLHTPTEAGIQKASQS